MSLLEVLAIIGAFPVGGSFIYACIRVGVVAGRTDGRLSNLAEGLERVTDSLERFVEKADDRLNKHGERLTRVEVHLGIEPDRGSGA